MREKLWKGDNCVPAGFSPAYTLKHRKAIRETPTQERLSIVIIPTYKSL